MIRKITFKTSDFVVTRIYTSEKQQIVQNSLNIPDSNQNREKRKKRKKRENFKGEKTFNVDKGYVATKKPKRRSKAEITQCYQPQRIEKQFELMKSFEASASKIAKISERIEASSENIKTRVEELYNMSHHNKIIVSDNLICDKPMETLLSQTREKSYLRYQSIE